MTITNNDVDKLKVVFATKDEFNRLQGDVSVLTDMVRTGFDKVMGELEKVREDRLLAKAEDDRQNMRLDKLEAKVG